jgi:small subunit ribosomal protein S18
MARKKSSSNSNSNSNRTERKGKDTGKKVRKKVCVFCKEHVDWVDYKDVSLLRRFMSDRAKIRARRVTGNCAQHQRDVAVAIKTARELALLPYATRVTSSRGGGGRGRRDREDRGDRPDRGDRGDRPPRDEAPAAAVDEEAAPASEEEVVA